MQSSQNTTQIRTNIITKEQFKSLKVKGIIQETGWNSYCLGQRYEESLLNEKINHLLGKRIVCNSYTNWPSTDVDHSTFYSNRCGWIPNWMLRRNYKYLIERY